MVGIDYYITFIEQVFGRYEIGMRKLVERWMQTVTAAEIIGAIEKQCNHRDSNWPPSVAKLSNESYRVDFRKLQF